MTKIYVPFLLWWAYLLSTPAVLAQTHLPLIRATSAHVAIRDGGYLDKNAWTLSPKAKPDVYTADRTRETKWVTFYTDLDSIRLQVKPGTRTNFVILLNGRDSCYTQVVSSLPRPLTRRPAAAAPDTIPFTLTADDIIAVRAVLNQQDTLLLHFDTGSFEVRLTREAILHKTHLLADQAAALAGTTPPNYNKLRPATTLQLGTFTLLAPPVLATGLTGQGMDGRFGYALFEGKQVAIDYDHQRLLVYSRLPRKAVRGYTKTKLVFRRSYVCVQAAFAINHQTYPGEFLLDTGTNQAVIVDSAWASQQQFPRTLPLLKTVVLHNPKGVKFETRVVLAPAFTLAHFQATAIPTNLLGTANPARFAINNLGNGFLKRFNLIFDFAHDVLYLQPNQQWCHSFREPT
jgi:hypothetical protein